MTKSIATKEVTMRRNGKWAKLVTVAKGKFALARGWEGEFKAKDVLTFGTRAHAKVYADGWLDD